VITRGRQFDDKQRALMSHARMLTWRINRLFERRDESA